MAKKSQPAESDYALQAHSSTRPVAAPKLPYQPPRPRSFRPRIGLIGCGGITPIHLRAYRRAGYEVVAFCDLKRGLAQQRRDEYYPRASVHADYRELLARHDIDVVDAATHPEQREGILADAIRAGKHVLSQKPLAVNLDVGQRLVLAAQHKGVRLAVNQNGRWAPHFSYLRQAIAAGLIGEVVSADMAVHWDHNWVKGTPFDRIPHLLLYDFAIHWFDILHCFLPQDRAGEVAARLHRSVHQAARPPLLGHVSVQYPSALASLTLIGNSRFGAQDRTLVVGTEGALISQGPDLNHQKVTLYTAQGVARPRLSGTWFTSGFEGTMGELLCAIEEDRSPSNSAEDNLQSLALAFAAIGSAEKHKPVKPGAVRRLRPEWIHPRPRSH